MTELSENEKKLHNLELLTNANDILYSIKEKYSNGSIKGLTGKVDISKGKYKLTFTYEECL